MTVWNELEPLLGKVQKPARYIGCEDGAQAPEHHPEAASWLLTYPDTFEIGLPNQGLQITNERSDGDQWAERLIGSLPVGPEVTAVAEIPSDTMSPYLLHLAVVGPTDDGTEIEAHLATQPRGLRISELITVLDPTWDEGRVRRITQWTLLDGARCEPLVGSSGATSAPHAQARAS